MAEHDELSTEQIVAFITSIVNDAGFTEDKLASLPDTQPELVNLCRLIYSIRSFCVALSQGDLMHVCRERGYTTGLLKSLAANLRHLTWLMQSLSQDHYIEADPYMGDFSVTFNDLNTALSKKSRELTALIDEYKRLSYVDALTGLPNRRAFFENAIREVQLSRRATRSTCLVMADVDFFKSVNDQYGHKCGDFVLQTLARRFQDSLRMEDMCSRFGGEEFLILLRETNMERAREIGERLRHSCASKPVDLGETTITVTASFGIAEVTAAMLESSATPQSILETTIQLADQALYEAKESGRNRVCCAEQ